MATPTQPRKPPMPTARATSVRYLVMAPLLAGPGISSLASNLMRLLCALCLLVLGAVIVVSTAAAQSSGLPGRIVFVKDGDLWLLDASGAHQLATGGTFSQPNWSPDGSGLAYVYRGTNFADIFVTDDHGQNQVRLTNSASTILDNTDSHFRPTFSPHAKLIAFVSDTTSPFPTLWLTNAADGSGRSAL